MNLQEYYLLKAIRESDIKYTSYKVDHKTGCSYIDGINKGLVFPISLLSLCKSKWYDRTLEYYFSGVLTPKRNWCKQYNTLGIIKNSDRGRNVNIKYTYDIEYYELLGKTKFALCPTGDCNWSYRFFEAIMCGAIPVLGDDDIDILSKDFKYYRHSDEKQYNLDWVDYNFKLFLKKNKL